jgi:hypothetical protein
LFNDSRGFGHGLLLSRRETPERYIEFFSPQNGGCRESRVPNAPAASYAKVKSIRVSHHRFTGSIRPSLRNGFNGFLRALLGDRALLSPSQVTMRKHRHQLDISVGISGPHDFTVRNRSVRLARCRVHRIPRPTFVTIAIRPSWRARNDRDNAVDLRPRSTQGVCGNLTRRANHLGGEKICQVTSNCCCYRHCEE